MIGARGRLAVLVGLVGTAAAQAACDGEGTPAGRAATVRDSAGVGIVENADAAWRASEALRLAREPALVIGDGSGDDAPELYQVQAVHRLSDGRIAVANGGSAEIHVYGADGALRHTAGGQGGGPGEFGRLAWLDVGAGDSIVAYDAGQRRFAVYDGTGAFIRVVTPSASGDRPLIPRPVALLDDGAVLATRSTVLAGAPPASGTLLRDTVAFVRIGRDGAARELPARVPGDERSIRITEGVIEILTPPFAPRVVVAARGDRLYAARGGGYELAQYDTTGRLLRLVRLSVATRPVTTNDVEARIEQITSTIANAGARQRTAAGLRALPVPDRMPAVARLVVDDEGRLWAMDFLAPRDTVATWRVFRADGGYLGIVPMPRTFTVHEIAGGQVLGVYRDENDVEQVRAYALAGGTGQ